MFLSFWKKKIMFASILFVSEIIHYIYQFNSS